MPRPGAGWELLPSPPGTAARAGPGAAGRENHTGHVVGEGAERIPAHPWNMATVGKAPKKSCPAFNSAAESWVSLQLHWEEFLSGIALGRTRLLEGCGLPFQLDPNYMFDSTCCLACQEGKIKPPFLCGLFFF